MNPVAKASGYSRLVTLGERLTGDTRIGPASLVRKVKGISGLLSGELDHSSRERMKRHAGRRAAEKPPSPAAPARSKEVIWLILPVAYARLKD